MDPLENRASCVPVMIVRFVMMVLQVQESVRASLVGTKIAQTVKVDCTVLNAAKPAQRHVSCLEHVMMALMVQEPAHPASLGL